MVGYMKRYDPGNTLARDTIRRWRESGEAGRLLYARNHGFCGDWIAGLDTSGMITTDEPYPPSSSLQETLPAWLPADKASGYVGYLQQYTHNINLLRYLLDAGDRVGVRAVDLDADGLTGLVTLNLAGPRGVIESAISRFHAWDEHTQVYFEGGWVQVWPPGLFDRPGQSRVEVYQNGAHGASYAYPVAAPQTAWHYRAEAAAFVRALHTGEPFAASGKDTLTDVRLYEEIYRRVVNRQ